jgi:hypothetical protein
MGRHDFFFQAEHESDEETWEDSIVKIARISDI